MTAPKEKNRKCVGWGIWDITLNRLWSDSMGRARWLRYKDAMEAWEYEYGEGSYRFCRKHGEIIDKKLWVEL